MAKFNKDFFNWDGMYLFYAIDGNQRNTAPDNYKFVARFKYSTRDRRGFQSFLTKNFTVEEYFSALEGPGPVGPVNVLEAKGYVSATVKSSLKQAGFLPTIEGKKAYLANSYKNTMDRISGVAM
jgi:hypothetical protein